MTRHAFIIGLVIFLAFGTILEPVMTLAYGPWLLWLALAIWLGWMVPEKVQATEKPVRDFGRRFALGSVTVTLMSLPVVYAIATMQRSLFGEEGLRWMFKLADPQVLIATVVFLAPMVYIPLLSVRCVLMYLREREAG